MTGTDTTGRTRPGVVVLIGFLALLAGHFTLDRIGLTVPVVNDTRVIIFVAFLTAFCLEASNAGTSFAIKSSVGRRCLYCILVLFGYQAVSVSWAPAGSELTGAVGDLMAAAVLLVVYWILAEWDSDGVVEKTLGCLLAAGIVYFLVAASGRGHDPSGRWAALGGGPNVFVRIMVLASIAAGYFYLKSGGRVVWLLPIPAFITGALSSGSRGGVAAALLTILVAVPSMLPRLRVGRAVSVAITALILAAITWLVIGDSISQLVRDRFVTTTFEQRYTSDRDVLYSTAFDLFKDNPIVGVGMNGFYELTNGGVGEMYVHNLPLAVAAEGGLIGLLLLGTAFYALRRGYAVTPLRQRTIQSRAAAYCGIFVGGASLFSGNYYDARLMWIFLILAAVGSSARPTEAPASINPDRKVALVRHG
jgi:O-antigen ligase